MPSSYSLTAISATSRVSLAFWYDTSTALVLDRDDLAGVADEAVPRPAIAASTPTRALTSGGQHLLPVGAGLLPRTTPRTASTRRGWRALGLERVARLHRQPQ